MGALVEIAEVSLREPRPTELHGGFVDEPRPGAMLDAHAVDVLGWALGAERTRRCCRVLDWRRGLLAGAAAGRAPGLGRGLPGAPRGGQGRIPHDPQPDRHAGRVRARRSSIVLKGQQRVAAGDDLAAATAGAATARRPSAELVSVVIPCYGQAHYLGEAIESVLAQTYPHLEIVVDRRRVDRQRLAASPRAIPACAACASGTRAWPAPATSASAARNGDFLVFLDADDRLLPEAIETGVRDARASTPSALPRSAPTAAPRHDGRRLDTHSQPAVDTRPVRAADARQLGWLPRARDLPALALRARARLRRRAWTPRPTSPSTWRSRASFRSAATRRWSPSTASTGTTSATNAAKMLVETLAAMRQQRRYAQARPRAEARLSRGHSPLEALLGRPAGRLRRASPGASAASAMPCASSLLLARRRPGGWRGYLRLLTDRWRA